MRGDAKQVRFLYSLGISGVKVGDKARNVPSMLPRNWPVLDVASVRFVVDASGRNVGIVNAIMQYASFRAP